MIVAYLEKIKGEFIEEKTDIESKLSESIVMKKEHIEFIKLLEKNDDSNMEAFTPRSVINSFHKRKIEELKAEQREIELKISEIEMNLKNINDKIDEINLVIEDTKKRLDRCFK